METPYCIQRAKFESQPTKTGIDTILRMDYMGSAEFEFGALPESLKRLRKDISEYGYFTKVFDGDFTKVVTIFCKKTDIDEASKILEDIVKEKIRLKASPRLKDWVSPGSFSYDTTDFWWDIGNDFMFWKFNPEFEGKFKQVIK